MNTTTTTVSPPSAASQPSLLAGCWRAADRVRIGPAIHHIGNGGNVDA